MRIISKVLLITVSLFCFLSAERAKEPYWIKILNYHEIFPESWMKSNDPKLNRFTKPSDRMLIVTAENFDKQVEFLSQNYKLVKMSDFAEHLSRKQPYDQNVVIITFDGADETIYKYAYPVLKKYNASATLFLHINSVRFDKTAMKWETIKKIHEEGLMEIESHSVSHPHMNRKKEEETEEAYETRIRKELADSKAIIEEKLNKKVECFAYPYGGYNETVIRLLKETGYKTSVTVQWDKNTINSNPYTLKRRGIFGAHSLSKFIEIFKNNVKDDMREYAD
ncbi:MAG: polysaccharide deacetylase family protein [Candidatus Firestonebacteria bacterium]